jgi:hypothetical protein
MVDLTLAEESVRSKMGPLSIILDLTSPGSAKLYVNIGKKLKEDCNLEETIPHFFLF